MKKQMGNAKGFTLVEIMIVVAIIGVLAAIAIPQYLNFTWKSKRAEAYVMLRAIDQAEQSYYGLYEQFIYDFASSYTTLTHLGLNDGLVDTANGAMSINGYLVSISGGPGFCFASENTCYAVSMENRGLSPSGFDSDPLTDLLLLRSAQYDGGLAFLPAHTPLLVWDDITNVTLF